MTAKGKDHKDRKTAVNRSKHSRSTLQHDSVRHDSFFLLKAHQTKRKAHRIKTKKKQCIYQRDQTVDTHREKKRRNEAEKGNHVGHPQSQRQNNDPPPTTHFEDGHCHVLFFFFTFPHFLPRAVVTNEYQQIDRVGWFTFTHTPVAIVRGAPHSVVTASVRSGHRRKSGRSCTVPLCHFIQPVTFYPSFFQ